MLCSHMVLLSMIPAVGGRVQVSAENREAFATAPLRSFPALPPSAQQSCPHSPPWHTGSPEACSPAWSIQMLVQPSLLSRPPLHWGPYSIHDWGRGGGPNAWEPHPGSLCIYRCHELTLYRKVRKNPFPYVCSRSPACLCSDLPGGIEKTVGSLFSLKLQVPRHCGEAWDTWFLGRESLIWDHNLELKIIFFSCLEI